MYAGDWTQLPFANKSATLQRLRELEDDMHHSAGRLMRLHSGEFDKSFMEVLSSKDQFESYCHSLRNSMDAKHHVMDLLGGTYDEGSLQQMETILWNLVQLEPKRKSIIDECKTLLLQDDIGPLLLINQGKEELVVQNELKKYLPFQKDIQDILLYQDQQLASLSHDYHDFMVSQQHGATTDPLITLEVSLRDRLKSYQLQQSDMK